MKNVNFKFIKTRTGFHYVGCFYYSENLIWAAQNPRLGRMRPAGRGLDMADLFPYWFSTHNGVYDVIDYECLKLHPYIFFLTVSTYS